MIETEVLEMGSFATLGITDNLIDILKKQGVIDQHLFKHKQFRRFLKDGI